MNCKLPKYLSLYLLLLLLFSIMISDVSAQDNFVLKSEQHWDTYEVGGTCNHGTNNLVIADLDGDSYPEIMQGGFSYNMINGSRTSFMAPLTMWNWKDENFTLKQSLKWPGTIEVTYAADVDNDGAKEIITGGLFKNDSGAFSSLRIWHYSDGELSLEAHYEGISVSSICVSAFNGAPAIFATGNFDSDSQNRAQLFLWHLDGNTLVLDNSCKLGAANVASSSSVYVSNETENGQVEIYTAGYFGNLNDSKGQLCIWNLKGNTLSLDANMLWQMYSGGWAPNIAGGVLGNTLVNNLKVGDVDGNGVPEIVTGGFTYDGSKALGQLRIWNWNGATLTLKTSREWTYDDITEVMSVALGDVDSDSRTEIVSGGMLAPYGSFNSNASGQDRGQLCVWSFDGNKLVLKESQNWDFAQGVSVWNVGTADLNNDGRVEIVSSGCISVNNLCDPDMRIWMIQSESGGLVFPVLSILAAAIILVISVLSVTFLVLRKWRFKKDNFS
jgi:hypothetical protein